MLSVDQRCQFRQNLFGDGQQVSVTLQHACELSDVRFEPVLLGVLLRGVFEVANPSH